MVSIDDIPNEILSIVVKMAYKVPSDKYNMMRVNRRFYAHSCRLTIDIADDIFYDSLEANKWLIDACRKRIGMSFERMLSRKKKEVMLTGPVYIDIVTGNINLRFGAKYNCIRSYGHKPDIISIFSLPHAKYPTGEMIEYARIVIPVIRFIVATFGYNFILKDKYIV